MKLKQLLASALLLCSIGATAQTDVTSTYLTNADFSQTTALTGTYLYGYGKDGSPYGFQTVDGWTSVVTSGDNSNNSYPNSGVAGGVFSYGSSTQLKGNGKAAPATNPEGEASGNCFGFFGVWGCGGYYYQNVTLAAGKYTITVPMYSQSGTQANTTYTGFFPTSGTNRTVAVNPTVGQWVNQTVTFTLADETAGQIRIGYQSTGSGSGANPMLFIDCVKIEFTAIVVKDVLSTALTAANKANTALGGTLDSAIATAQAVYDNEDATQEEVNAAAYSLNSAVEQAMSTADNIDVTELFLANADMSSTDGWTAYVSSDYRDYGNGLIGTYNVRFSAATVDETHLNTENCFGFECRWSGNYASFNQTTDPVPAGVYELSFDVENVNGTTTSASYNNLFYVQVGDTKTTDTSTEWMRSKSGWTSHKIRVTVNEASPLTISLGYGTGSNNIGSDNTPAIYVSHLKLNYSSFLAGAKAAYDEAVANAATAKEDNPIVTGSELTALNEELAKAEPTTIEGYNAAAEAINTAKNALVAAAASYNALAEVNAMITAAGTLEYADANKKPSAEVSATSASDADTKTASQYTALRQYYESNAMAEGVAAAEDYTSAVADANAATNTGWTNGIGTNSGQGFTDGDGNLNQPYLDGGWSSSAGANINMSREVVIPAGTYLLSVTARGSNDLDTYTLSIGGENVEMPRNGSVGSVFGNGWSDVSVVFTTDGHPTTLTVVAQSEAKYQWISINRFRLMQLELNAAAYADADDYADLNTAIADAEAKTLGFQQNEYAPYNNIGALQLLADAKAIDQDAVLTNLKEDVQAATAALEGATWTNNGDKKADIIYNGMFATVAEGQNYPDGWTRTNGWGQMQSGLSGDYATAYYNQPGSLQYGNQGLYTMPLRGNSAYAVSFSYRSHENNSNKGVTVSVQNVATGEYALEEVTFGGNSSTSEWKSVEASFATPVGGDGNYVLTIANNGNTWITNVKFDYFGNYNGYPSYLIAPFYEDFGLYDGGYKDEGVYPHVTLERSYKGGLAWNTFVVPFDVTNEELMDAMYEDVEVAEFSETVVDEVNEYVTVSFTTMETPSIKANTPVLIRTKLFDSNNFDGEIDFGAKRIIICDESEAKVEGTIFDFVAVYKYFDDSDVDNPIPFTIAENDYFIGNNALYKSAGTTTIKPFRAYLKNKTGQPLVKANLYIDGIATSIDEINGTENTEDGAIYTIAGQRVQKAQKGLYIVNGKKVLVK